MQGNFHLFQHIRNLMICARCVQKLTAFILFPNGTYCKFCFISKQSSLMETRKFMNRIFIRTRTPNIHINVKYQLTWLLTFSDHPLQWQNCLMVYHRGSVTLSMTFLLSLLNIAITHEMQEIFYKSNHRNKYQVPYANPSF